MRTEDVHNSVSQIKKCEYICTMSENFDYERFKKEAATKLLNGGKLSGSDNILLPLIKDLLEDAMQAELESHLNEEKAKGAIKSNRKNGSTSKTMRCETGDFELKTPRDRNGNFNPHIVKKQQTFLGEAFQEKIISLYCSGMSYKDIQDTLEELYGVDISKGKISEITDKIYPELEKWKLRALDAIYAFIWLDAIHFSVRENGVTKKKAVYIILGYNLEGEKQILDIRLGQSESSKYWLQILEDLQKRGVEDIFIACMDNLKGFTQAMEAVFPRTLIQLCIIHQIRNSMKYVVYKDSKILMADLKKIYQASTLSLAEIAMDEFEEKWNEKYPLIVRSWRKNWEHLTNFFDYSPAIRKIMYTTNIIEGFNRQIRKYTKTKGSFCNDKALMKLVLAVSRSISEKWEAKPSNWGLIQQQLKIKFEDRFKER